MSSLSREQDLVWPPSSVFS